VRESSAATAFELPLLGAGGEPVSFRGTIGSHGLAWLPPNEIAAGGLALATTLGLGDGTARRIALGARDERLVIAVAGRPPGARARAEIVALVRAMFGLDDDLTPFYARLRDDAELAFALDGTGRLLRSPTAFEDVARTICTTNCAWSATQRMIAALVAHLGTAAPARSPRRGAGARFRPRHKSRLPTMRSFATWRARATGARIFARSRAPSLRARSISKRGGVRGGTSFQTKRSKRTCSRCRGSGRTQPRTR